MEIISLDCGCRFLEADVVEACKRRPADVLDCVVRNLRDDFRKCLTLERFQFFEFLQNMKQSQQGFLHL